MIHHLMLWEGRLPLPLFYGIVYAQDLITLEEKKMDHFAAVILAAGKGMRMKSTLPKVLHQAAGRSLVEIVCSVAAPVVNGEICIVVGHGADQVRETLGDGFLYALQEQQLGTGHAVGQALPAFSVLPEHLLVLCGDTPLLRTETLSALCSSYLESKADCTVMTAVLPDGGAYGRVIRNARGEVEAIVEARDASPAQKAVREINSGVYCFRTRLLQQCLAGLQPDNDQGEYYLTDVVAAMRSRGCMVNAFICEDAEEISGVNDRVQLAAVSRVLRRRKNEALMRAGVTMIDPETVYIDNDVEIGPDTVLEPQVYLHGTTHIGACCHIGPGVKIVDSQVGNGCEIGPFAYLRPGTILADHVKAGHFVEIKKSCIGKGSKVPHLSYIGDAEIGERVNIGCGTITCNYDGKLKHKTQIGNDVFVGSNTNFVAPVEIGDHAFIAAGSTVTENVPPHTLAVARGRQRNIEGWAPWHAENAKKVETE